MQQKTLSRSELLIETKSSPKQQHYKTATVTLSSSVPPSPSSESTSTSSSQNQDNINLDEYETVNVDPNDDAPEYASLMVNANTAVKRKPRKI